MTVASDIRQVKRPVDALLSLAHEIDRLKARVDALEAGGAGWDSWGDEPEPTIESLHGAETAEPPVTVTPESVMFRPVSEEKQARRRQFADQQLHLQQALSNVDDTEDWIEHYVMGGPLWLYYGNRELVMSYPDEVRAQMVADVDEESSEIAHEMSRDILKHPCEVPDVASGQGAIGIGEINGKGGNAISGNAGGIKGV